MKNRLSPLKRYFIPLLFSIYVGIPHLQAQLDFTFNYSGPDALYVDTSCTAILDWGAPGSISAACNNSGCVITTFEVVSITGGYAEGDSVPAGMNVLITYYVQDNQNNDAFFGFDIDIIDTIRPVFDSTSLPMSLNVPCLSQVPDVPDINSIIAIDNCPPANAPPMEVVITYDGQSNTLLPCEGGTFTRTWTATDLFGNTTQYVQTVIVAEDIDPPSITGFPTNLTESCDTADYLAWIEAQRLAFMATDMGCGIVGTTDDAPAVFEENCDMLIVTFTATDACGLTATAQATYTVTDTEAPVIVPPASMDITLECAAGPSDPLTQILSWGDSLNASDNCGEIIWTDDFIALTGGCGGNTGTTTVTYTGEDACGQSSAITLNFTVEDNTPPNIDPAPADTTITCDGTGNNAALITWLNNLGGAIASDVCTPTIGITTAWQLDGNTVTTAQIQDSLNTQLLGNCGASISIDFAFTDVCGNTAIAAASFIITDLVPPVWDVDPLDLVIECDGSADPNGAIAAWLLANGNGIASDVCGGVNISHDFTTLTNDCGTTGTTTVTFDAMDNCGNSNPRTVTVSIVDNTPPVWDIAPANLEIECDGSADPNGAMAAWLLANGNGSASDACSGGVIYSNDYTNLIDDCGNTGTAIVTFTATDSCGLASIQTATVSIVDNTPPVWTDLPDALAIPCDGTTDPTLAIADWLNNNGNGSATDACSGGVIYSNDYTGLTGGCGGNTGTAVVTFTATDSCGLAADQVAIVSVVDLTPPVWTADPTDLLLSCDGATDIITEINQWLAISGNGTATDACNAFSISNDYAGAIPGCTPASAVTVTFTAEDDCMNTSSRTAIILITDNDPPVIAIEARDTIVDCDTPTISFADWLETHGGAEASDGCYTVDNSIGSTDWTANPLALINSCGNSYSQAVEFIVMDACGNADTTMATYTVVDNTPPVFTRSPLGKIEACSGGNDQMLLNDWIDAYGDAIIADGCGTATFINFDYTTSDGSNNTNVPFGNPALYPVVLPNDCGWFVQVTFRIEDACGFQHEETAGFFFSDIINPVLIGIPADTTIDCKDTAPLPTVTAIDNCDAMLTVSMTADTVAGVCPILQQITRTWMATDDCGNSNTGTQIISVVDNNAPVLVGVPMNTTVACDMIPTAPTVSATDDCDANPIVSFAETDNRPNDGSCADYNYTLTRIWTATDACGNTSTSSQTITISDTEAPTFTGPADLTLNCGQSTDTLVTGTPTGLLDQCDPGPTLSYFDVTSGGNCSNSFTITRVWSAADACGNVSMDYEQSITIADTEAPVFGMVAENMDLTCVNSAGAEVAFMDWVNNYANASASDNCSVTAALNWFAAVPGTYDINDPNSFPGTSPGTLDPAACPSVTPGLLRFETVDFVVYDECNNASVSTATFNLTDNTAPVFDDCPANQTIIPLGGACEETLTLAVPLITESCTPNELILEYSINGGTPVDWTPLTPVMLTLALGQHTIVYTARDCAGNENTCTYTISILDTEAPSISCPADTIVALGATDDCSVGIDVMLPLPAGITDNCGFPIFTQTQPFNSQDALLTFSFDANYQDYIADDKVFNFVATAANAAGSTVTFTIRVEGDVAGTEEYFTILGEDGSVLGVTEANQAYVNFTTGNCMANPVEHSVVTATIPVPSSTYNAWALDGIVTLTAISNKNFSAPAPGGPGDGINPSCTSFTAGTPDGQNDGSSNISIQLTANTASSYYFTTGATTTPPTVMLPPVIAPTLTFAIGESDVFYVISDLSGNEDTCSFKVTVVDTISPVVNCQATTIFVNPSGLDTYTLDPSEIDNGSTDNCGIVAYSVSPNTFDCSMAGTFVDVTLTATDAAGNTSTCETIVAVETEGPSPSYSIGLCGNDTLYLFANPPAASGGVVYTYLWSGPNGFTSTLENPFIPNVGVGNSGTYSVEVSGLTACTATGTVEVLISGTPNTPIIAANSNQLCTTDDLVLSTLQYSGNSVTYNWYAGIFPGGTFITSTTIPTYTIFAPLAANTNTYFVIVEVDGCVSDASSFTTVTVTEPPLANTNDAQIDICEGEDFSLGVPVITPGLTYAWTGPNGFTSDQANPPTFTNTSTVQSGTYTLIVSANDCPSLPATTQVNITAQPAQPIIASPGLVCVGESVVFITNIAGGDLYTWTAPNFSTQTTSTNTLSLPSAGLSDAGQWTVSVTIDACSSIPSEPVMLFVEPEPNAIAINDGPVCEGSTVQLSANEILGASYVWSGPGNFTSIMQNPTANAEAGIYSVTITAVSGCSNTAITTVAINTAPQIIAVNNTGASCANGSDDITLSAEVSPVDPGNYTYLWTGPNAYASIVNSPILANVTSANNGPYQVVVTNSEGCSSLPMETMVNVSDVPTAPLIDGDQVYCVGANALLTTSAYPGGNVVYNWVTPTDTQMTSIPSLNLQMVSLADSGTYQLYVTVDGCSSNLSPEFEIIINAKPDMPVITGDTLVCVGENIELNTPLIPGATYMWNGPAGFAETAHNPIILNATDANEGAYSVQVSINGCTSSLSFPIIVQVNEPAIVPTILNDGPVCIDATDAEILLSVSPGTAIPGAMYTWYAAATNTPIAGPSAALSTSITDFSAYGAGSHDFYVIVELNGCVSPSSVPTTVVMDAIPNILAFAGDDIRLCNMTTIALAAEAPTTGSGLWTQISGPPVNISNPTEANSILIGLQASQVYTFEWTLSNGACTNYSSDQVTLTVDGTTELADAGLNQTLCNVDQTNLSATVSTMGSSGVWSQSPAQEAMGIVIVDLNDPNSLVTGLSAGIVYEFVWSLSNPGCGIFSTDMTTVSIEENESIAFAGLDFEECADGLIQLNADDPISGQGTWTSDDPDLTIIEPNNPNTLVNGFIVSGIYTFVWTLDNNACGITSDEVTVIFESAPVAFDDNAEVPFAETIEINVKENDAISSPFTVAITMAPAHGQLAVLAPGEFAYAADPGYAGEDEFNYTVCSQACPDVCSEALVTLVIGTDVDCKIPTIFTPNNDLVNDSFIIPCLATDNFPENVVSIFNQWGDEVFRAAPYKNDWQGTYKGEELPAGTYYFVASFGPGQEPQAGFLVLER